MVGRTLDWKEELGRWLKPFLDRLGHKARRQMCPPIISTTAKSMIYEAFSVDNDFVCSSFVLLRK
jgi:hypothetical protein